MKPPRAAFAAIACALLLGTGAAQAGRSCEARLPSIQSVRQSMALAEHAAAALDASGAQVVLLARIGQNLSAYGIRYSHFAFAYRDSSGAAPAWRVVHKLNQCGTANGSLYRQGLADFFLDDLYEYEAAIVVPRPEVQAGLLPVLADNARIAQLDTPAYSMVAYPWSQTYQQSNQWALETLAMTQEPAARTRVRAQAWLQLHGYQPAVLRIGALQRLGGRMTAANIAFDDHPNEKRFADRIETVTVDSVFSWLAGSGLAGPVQTVR